MEDKKKWIKKAIKHPGALHAQLGIHEDDPIPMNVLENCAKKKGRLGKRCRLAITLKKMNK